ncbi:hypothetical protein K1719_034787 [Acacia pycnantha]|nr:hypothetical protein K1719_034787 [Acacia pycnantha]
MMGRGSISENTEGERSARGGANGSPMASIRKGAPLFSYGTSQVSPGGAGFLVQHSEDDDITQGWKDYFHKMNEKDSRCDADESDDEENLETRRMEGNQKIEVYYQEYAAWCMPWMNSQIIKILGANFPTYVIRDRINRMWRPKYPLKLIPLSNGYFIVSFSNKEDRAYAFQEGPWMIEDHYLTVQRWRPNFNPQKADLQCNIAAWVRLPDVPFEFYNVESLRRIGNKIGKMIKVDRSTSIYDKGGFARICVEIDLKKPLLPSYLVFGEERSIIYEGLHQVCFECGQYGNQKSVCPTKLSQPNMPVYEHGTETSNVGGDGENNVEKGVEQGSAKAKVGGEDNSSVAKGVGGRNQSAGGDGVGKDGLSRPENATKLAGRKNSVSGGVVADGNPFGKLKILRRDFRGHLNVIDAKEVIPGSPSVTVERINVEPSKDNQ